MSQLFSALRTSSRLTQTQTERDTHTMRKAQIYGEIDQLHIICSGSFSARHMEDITRRTCVALTYRLMTFLSVVGHLKPPTERRPVSTTGPGTRLATITPIPIEHEPHRRGYGTARSGGAVGRSIWFAYGTCCPSERPSIIHAKPLSDSNL